MSAPLAVAVDEHGSSATVTVTGELDLATSPTLAAELSACRDAAVDEITLDLSGIEFIDCSGLHCVLEAHRRGRLTVVPGTGPVRHLLALTGIDQRLVLAGHPLASRAA